MIVYVLIGVFLLAFVGLVVWEWSVADLRAEVRRCEESLAAATAELEQIRSAKVGAYYQSHLISGRIYGSNVRLHVLNVRHESLRACLETDPF